MEPHLVHIFHDENNDPKAKGQLSFDSFIEYGHRFENMEVEGTGKKVKDFIK